MIGILRLLLILGCAKCVCHEHLPRTEDGSRALFGRCAMYVLLHLGRFNNNLQSTGSDVDGCVWSVAEVCIGIVGACLPTLRPLFNRGHHLRPERSSQEVHHGYSYGAEHSWKDQTKQIQTTITAVKPSRSRNENRSPFASYTISTPKPTESTSDDQRPLVQTTITTTKPSRNHDERHLMWDPITVAKPSRSMTVQPPRPPRPGSSDGRSPLYSDTMSEAHMHW